jgi:hypothetical protein
MAPKGQKTSGEVLSGERAAGRSCGVGCRETSHTVDTRTARWSLTATRCVCPVGSEEAESLGADEPLDESGGNPFVETPQGVGRFRPSA